MAVAIMRSRRASRKVRGLADTDSAAAAPDWRRRGSTAAAGALYQLMLRRL
jgi:hypothetical protein